MYTFGIDTTYRLTGLAVVKEDNSVLYNKVIELDISHVHADYFLNAHLKNILLLLKDISESMWQGIDLIAVVNTPGAFHSLPVGVTAACVLGQIYKKNVIGINHEIGHIYSNWVNRNDDEFQFPVLVLNISGAHNTIEYVKGHGDIQTIYEILFTSQKDAFTGITVFLEWFCKEIGIIVPQVGKGGAIFSEMAVKGRFRDFPEFKKIRWIDKGGEIWITNLAWCVQHIKRKYKRELLKPEFKSDLARSFSNFLYGLFAEKMLEMVEDYGAKEIHLAGGISVNPLLRQIMEEATRNAGLKFKAPLKEEFCLDNAAMVAVAGYYKNKNKVFTNESITIVPEGWFYQHYFRKMFKNE